MKLNLVWLQNFYVYTALLYGLLMHFVEHHIELNVIEHKKH
jgi:hypothetical protein